MTVERGFDRPDVDFLHHHHRVERTLGCGTIRGSGRIDQRRWRDLPMDSPFIFAPSGLASSSLS
jgi:hypothetical protein